MITNQLIQNSILINPNQDAALIITVGATLALVMMFIYDLYHDYKESHI